MLSGMADLASLEWARSERAPRERLAEPDHFECAGGPLEAGRRRAVVSVTSTEWPAHFSRPMCRGDPHLYWLSRWPFPLSARWRCVLARISRTDPFRPRAHPVSQPPVAPGFAGSRNAPGFHDFRLARKRRPRWSAGRTGTTTRHGSTDADLESNGIVTQIEVRAHRQLLHLRPYRRPRGFSCAERLRGGVSDVRMGDVGDRDDGSLRTLPLGSAAVRIGRVSH
jgi:hypothetical protein